MQNFKNKFIFLCVLCVTVVNIPAQETPPAPSAPKSVTVPAVKQKELRNGLKVAVVERKGVPIVTVNLLLNAGARLELANEAGTADLTASLLTKGTKTKTATQIAEQIEFLGGSINAGAGWNLANVTMTVTSDKLDQALAILSDVVLRPSFAQKELDLLKTQSLDGLTYNLKQPGFLATYVASKYIFDEHPAGGTPETTKAVNKQNILDFYREFYQPADSVLIFTGDITLVRATLLSTKFFAGWKDSKRKEIIQAIDAGLDNTPVNSPVKSGDLQRILVVDLPNSGQASVNYGKAIDGGRAESDNVGDKVTSGKTYYPAIVLNSVLGGGYSSRLNLEIRIKRGLSYGAGSNFAWRYDRSNFLTRTQTKNQSAAEVVELVLAEIKKLTDSSVTKDELVPRKSVLTGNFGRNLETTNGLAGAIGDLYSFGIPASELNAYATNVNAVTDAQIMDFASHNLLGGDIIIVGDYSVFKDDLAKRFPNMTVEVIKADELDLSKANLRK